MLRKTLIILLCTWLSACANFGLRQQVVQEGNLIHADRVTQLKSGMTREQVATLMGTPLLDHPTADNRWDYVYLKKRTFGKIHKKRVSVFFSGNHVVRITHDGI